MYFGMAYNAFITLKNRVKEAWSDIEVQMKQLKFDGYYGPSYISLLGFPNLFYKYKNIEDLIIKLEE